MGISIEKAGRRHYLVGDTFAIKDRIKAAGGHWDGDKRAWWIGNAEKALEVAGHSSSASSERQAPPTSQLAEDDKIAGKASYKGREYIMVWEGTTSRGQACKLAFADGSKVFWAGAGEYQVTKRYEARRSSYRGRHDEPMTFGRLKALRAKYARARAEGNDDGVPNGQRYECEECGEYVTRGVGSCWETGCAH